MNILLSQRQQMSLISVIQDVFSDTPHCDVNDEPYLALDPMAVSAYLGDLYSLEFLSEDMFTTCMAFILNNFECPSQLQCVEVMLERANSYPVPRLDPQYLFECLGTIRRKARQLFGKKLSFVSHGKY